MPTVVLGCQSGVAVGWETWSSFLGAGWPGGLTSMVKAPNKPPYPGRQAQ